ncbi:MAG: glycosyltransferase [Planctomycetaceae bacterium]
MAKLPQQLFPPSNATTIEATSPTSHGIPQNGEHDGKPRALVWASALLTAPRDEPQIARTLDSLRDAGIADLHIFAEPGSWIPDRYQHLPTTHRTSRLGNLLNFYDCLTTLLRDHPSADVFAVFQDDIRAARGLKHWCDQEFWPQDCGVVSLFTPQLHSGRTVGWQLHCPGFQRVCGAQALVFRRDMLERFLSDPRVLQCLTLRENGSDAVLGGWLSREKLSIAYHTPSPIDHIGLVSSLYRCGPDRRNLGRAIECVSRLKDWSVPAARTGTIGLVGWDTPTGLGTINRELIRHLEIDHWFAPPHPRLAALCQAHQDVQVVTSLPQRSDQQEWAANLDWLLFAERPHVPELLRTAAHQGVGIACIPMWEWVQPQDRWLAFVDVMLCPTMHTYEFMQDWKSRYGFGWKAVYIPWPVDPHWFDFRQRQICQEFLFVNGWGGSATTRPDGSPTPYGRKGLEVILAAARQAPDLKFVVRSQATLPPNLPRNVRIASSPIDPRTLYCEGDVCVQPSHYEGLGHQLLECQAAGLPLVTTDARPMNEVQPWMTIPTFDREVLQVGSGYIASELIRPEDLVQTLRPLVGLGVSGASQQARTYIETHHSWSTATEMIHSELVKR